MQVPGLMYYHTGRDIYLTLYGSSSTEVPLADGTVAVEQTSDYPFSGESTIVLTPANPMTFALRLRIPTWLAAASFCLAAFIPMPMLRPGAGPSRSTVNRLMFPWKRALP